MTNILITGSNSGFGKLAALSLAREGHRVIATMRTVSKGDDLRRLAGEEGLAVARLRLRMAHGEGFEDRRDDLGGRHVLTLPRAGVLQPEVERGDQPGRAGAARVVRRRQPEEDELTVDVDELVAERGPRDAPPTLAAQRWLQEIGAAPGWPAAPCAAVWNTKGGRQCEAL